MSNELAITSTWPFIEFDDSKIVSGTVNMENALLSDSLSTDELNVEVYDEGAVQRKLLTVNRAWYHTSTESGGRGYVVGKNDIRSISFGAPIIYKSHGRTIGTFYFRSVEQTGECTFKINAVTGVGLLSEIPHMGGVYNGETAGWILYDMVYRNLKGEVAYIDSDVQSVELYGYLPVASVRDNLQQILFAIGASLYRDTEGRLHVGFLKNIPTRDIPSTRVLLGTPSVQKSPATEVTITEHSYYISDYDREVSLFDNTDGSGAADNLLVTFSNPCHDLKWNGGDLPSGWLSRGVNFCRVTGVGVLTGKEYTHATKTFSVPTGASGRQSQVRTIEKATMVSAVNSANVAARVVEYEMSAKEVSCGIYLADGENPIQTGTGISFTVQSGEEITGVISDMDIVMSGENKANCTLVTGYIPSHFGNNYTKRAVFTSSQTWTPPSGTSLVRIVIGQGGQAGQNGTSGTSASHDATPITFNIPGEGGQKGAGGSGGAVYTIDVANPSALTITIGAGGTANDGEAATGNVGTHSTVRVNNVTYSSSQGAIPQDGYYELLSGTRYSIQGIEGVDGVNGGEGKANESLPGESLIYNGTTWRGGSVGQYIETYSQKRYAYGGAGGGAAHGAAGNNGGDGYVMDNGNYRGGTGGAGANAAVMDFAPSPGSGGAGGCGGGGGGCGGFNKNERSNGYTTTGAGTSGAGGLYSKGTSGGSGYVIVYY